MLIPRAMLQGPCGCSTTAELPIPTRWLRFLPRCRTSSIEHFDWISRTRQHWSLTKLHGSLPENGRSLDPPPGLYANRDLAQLGLRRKATTLEHYTPEAPALEIGCCTPFRPSPPSYPGWSHASAERIKDELDRKPSTTYR